MPNRRFFFALLLALLPFVEAIAADARIVKVLPHHLDKQGRHMLAPSLFDRDAYQAHLRLHAEECSGLRFDVQWKTASASKTKLKLRLELRSGQNGSSKPLVLETPVEAPRFHSKWSSLTLKGEDYAKFRDLISWRATLWDGDVQIAEQKSFLW